MTEGLKWAAWPWQQCRARREPRPGQHSGRCELRRHGPEIDHALERGFDIPRWSTDWHDSDLEARLAEIRETARTLPAFLLGDRHLGKVVQLPDGTVGKLLRVDQVLYVMVDATNRKTARQGHELNPGDVVAFLTDEEADHA